MELSKQQQGALGSIQSFLNSDKSIFILKGYAGTGKTTLILHLIKLLKNRRLLCSVLAPTGRAAKILREKTNAGKSNENGYGQTIHRSIYNFDDVYIKKTKDQSDLDYFYHFPIRILDKSGHICIVDEASMVTSCENNHEILKFGTGRLLDDLLTHTRIPSSTNKIIFVGDPAQLPPFGETVSKALEAKYFENLSIHCEEFELTEVIRQKSGSTLLNNAMKVRDLIFADRRPELEFTWDDEMYSLEPDHVVDSFVNDFPKPSLRSGVIINFKNRDCLDYNLALRKHYFPGEESIQPGDILMITKNSYGVFGQDLYNGDMARVVSAEKETEVQSANVYVDEGGKKVKKLFSFRFRNVVLELPHIEHHVPVKIIDSMLNQPESGLSVHEMKGLFINFNIRFNAEQDRRKNNGLEKYTRNSQQFKDMLKADPYYNALHVKYGYSVTCHKAQGGEWDKVYVNFSGRNTLNTDNLRWSYTAITRARNELAAIHPPHVSALGSVTFTPVGRFKSVPKEAITYAEFSPTPWHGDHSHPAKLDLYYQVEERLSNTPYSIARVDTSDFRESYFITREDRIIRLDTTHNASGIFSPFVTNESGDNAEELSVLLNKPYDKNYKLNYSPGSDHFEKLLNKMKRVCSELDIQILSAIERPENSFVTYYLWLGANDYASIQFYHNRNHQFTKAIPKITNPDRSDVLDIINDQFS